MFRARQLAAASVAGGDQTGWFERPSGLRRG
jgi:hypothetical protein